MLKVAEVCLKNEQNSSSFLSTKCLLIVSNKIFTTVNKYFQKIKVMCGRMSKCWYHTANAELSRRTSGEEECWYFSCVTRILAAVVQQITQLGPRIVNTFYLPNFISISLSLSLFLLFNFLWLCLCFSFQHCSFFPLTERRGLLVIFFSHYKRLDWK